MSSEQFYPEKEVTVEKIFALFESAFLEPKLQKEFNRIEVGTSAHTSIYVDSERTQLMFSIWGSMKKSKDELTKLRFISRANSKLAFACFFMDDNGDFHDEYFLSFKGGITAHQIMHTYRAFDSFALQAIRILDTDCVIGEDGIST
jgi:hypothetical protein